MLEKLYDALSKIDWKYHVLDKPDGDKIMMKGISMDPQGIIEVMHIKELADEYRFNAKWDGQNVRIMLMEE